MKCLCVIDCLGPGGAQRQMVNLACGLKARGHNIELFTYYPSDHYQQILSEWNITVHLHLKSSKYSVSPIFALRKLIVKGGFDMVISFLDTPNLYAEITNLWVKNTKLVVSKRSAYPIGKLSSKFRLIQEFHRFADVITVNSCHQRKRMESEFTWMKKKIRTVYNGVDLDVFSPAPQRRVSSNELSLVAIASVSFNKNTLNLAKAIAICRDKYKIRVMLDWVGANETPVEGTLPIDETNAFLRKSKLSGQWKWKGVHNDVSQLLVSYDAIVHPSYFEGLPNVICEALACGIPVLASRACDNPILIQEGQTGHLFDPASPEDIAKSIVTFTCTGVKKRVSMSAKARKYAEEHLSIQRFVDEYEELFISLIPKTK